LSFRFGLDTPIPDTLEIGRGAVLLVRGFITPAPRAWRVELDGESLEYPGSGEVRFDRPREGNTPPCGIFLPIALDGRRAGTRVQLRISADGQPIVDQAIALRGTRRAALQIDTPIAICLGTYNPDAALLARQLESLRQQTRGDFTCIVHDDGSTPDKLEMIAAQVRSDARFRLVRSDENRGFYRNFEAALALVPSTTPYVAFCDQDDYWSPDKLALTIAALEAQPSAQLAYCDLRVVDRDGRVLSETYWSTRRNNYQHLETLLYANTVTGAAAVFRGALLDALLPFPPPQGVSFHDHWLACAAFVGGGIAYVDRPLYDYTQHAGNVIGHSSFGPLTVGTALARHLFNAIEMLVKPMQGWTNLWTMLAFYHYGYRRVQLIAQTLRLRFPELPEQTRAALALFDDRASRALELMTARHLEVLRRGDTTDMAEFKMGLGKLLHQTLAPLLPRVVGIKDRFLALAGRGTPSTAPPAAR
jgi:glycosyltransferase involved in cell wall biosynthesis